MKLSLKNVRGRLRLVVKSVGDKLRFIKECCCQESQLNNYAIFYNCCRTDNTRIAIKVSLAIEFYNQCSNNIGFVVVKIPGQEKCYSSNWPLRFIATLEQAQSAGLQIFDTRQQVECVETKTSSPSLKCRTETCPTCPNDCCIAIVYPRNCPDIQSGEVFNPLIDPSNYFCCSYGRQCLANWTHSFRKETKSYGACFIDSNTCFGNRLQEEGLTEYYDEETRRLTRCFEDGSRPEFGTECVFHNHYARQYENFYDVCTGASTHASDFEFQRWPGCIPDGNRSSLPNGPLPPPIIFPVRPVARPVATLSYCDNNDNIRIPEERIEGTSEDPICENIENETIVYRKSYDRDCQVYEQIKATTTFRYEANCLRGSYYFDQSIECRAYGFQCPPDGSLLWTEKTRRSSSYVISIELGTLCDPNLCNQYHRGQNQGSPFLKQDMFFSKSTTGALTLL
jgi:hypothetical protein